MGEIYRIKKEKKKTFSVLILLYVIGVVGDGIGYLTRSFDAIGIAMLVCTLLYYSSIQYVYTKNNRQYIKAIIYYLVLTIILTILLLLYINLNMYPSMVLNMFLIAINLMLIIKNAISIIKVIKM